MNYEIKSLNPIIPMSVVFDDNTLVVNIDVVNQHVYFENKEKNIDYDILEKNILDYINPNMISPPKIPEEVSKLISNVRAGNYQKDV